MVSLPFEINMRDFYDVEEEEKINKADLRFKITGMICYSGAHYICYFKNKDGFKPPIQSRMAGYSLGYSRKPDAKDRWKLLNDGLVEGRPSWKSVVEEVVTSKIRPTMLFYELMEESNCENIEQEIEDFKIDQIELQRLVYQVKD